MAQEKGNVVHRVSHSSGVKAVSMAEHEHHTYPQKGGGKGGKGGRERGGRGGGEGEGGRGQGEGEGAAVLVPPSLLKSNSYNPQ